MGIRHCPICSHGSRSAIEKKLREGASLSLLAQSYGVTDEVLRQHRDAHLNAVVSANNIAITPSKMDAAAMFLEHDECIRECKDLIDWSRANTHVHGWSSGIRLWLTAMHQQNQLLGLYDQVDPRLAQHRNRQLIDVVSRALEKFPDAQREVLAAIDQVEEDGEPTT
jgi:hypothetical protein